MRSSTDTTANTADIFTSNWGLQMSSIPRPAPGFKLEFPFLRKFPAFLGRASPLPAANATRGTSP
ncbi:MAG: hypothetical protein LBB26_02920 [Puniceicoccales bacterium]|nr:hypothetical protein [Puniceicoccales bacterium]